MTGKLTTHVLDISKGKPAAEVLIELWMLDSDDQFCFIQSCTTNQDGRVDEPLLKGDDMETGVYELRFHIGDFYRKSGSVIDAPAFLECVPVRFGLSDPEAHYHVPLLISPGGYSTYRGS